MLSWWMSLSPSQTACVVLGGLALALLLKKSWAVRNVLKALSYIPCHEIIWLHPMRALGITLITLYPGPKRAGHLYAKFNLYKQYGCSVLSSVVFWSATPVFWVADSDTLKKVLAETNVFTKDAEILKATSIYGPNLLSADGDQWRRFRIISSPAFNETSIALVWSTTNALLSDWFAHLQNRLDRLKAEYLTLDITPEFTQFSLAEFLSIAYGVKSIRFSDNARSLEPKYHASRLACLLVEMVDTAFIRLMCPEFLAQLSRSIFIPFLSKTMRRIHKITKELEEEMLRLISAARESILSDPDYDMTNATLLTHLVKANLNQEQGYKRLSDEELLSNVFIYHISGYDTISHSMSFTLTLLAMYPEVQRKIYEEVKRIWPDGSPSMGVPSLYKTDHKQLIYTIATFQEVLRLNPITPRMNKPASQDFTLIAHRFEPNTDPVLNGDEKTVERFEVHIPKGSVVMMDIEGIHMNTLVWGNDVKEFKPERFIDTPTYRWPRNAFLAFSAGPRKCIGSRFALAEAGAILANIVYSWEISLPPDTQTQLKKMEDSGISEYDRRQWLCHWVPGFTRMPLRAKVCLRKRVDKGEN